MSLLILALWIAFLYSACAVMHTIERRREVRAGAEMVAALRRAHRADVEAEREAS